MKRTVKVTTGLPSLGTLGGTVSPALFNACKGRKVAIVFEDDAVVALKLGLCGSEATMAREALGMNTDEGFDAVEVHYDPAGFVMMAFNVTLGHLREGGLAD